MQQLASLFNNFSLSWDLGVILFLFIAVLIYGFSVGQRRIGLLLISTYIGFVLVGLVPYLDTLISRVPNTQGSLGTALLFVVFVVVLFFIFAGSLLRTILGLPKKEEGQWWRLVALSIVTMGFFVSSLLALLPVSYYNSISTVTKAIFIDNFTHFFWAVAGVIVLVVVRRTKKKV